MNRTESTPEEPEVKVFDTTLRDGEQMPQLAFSLQDKLTIARKLDDLGVDVIEAGFPVNSPAELECVKAVAREVKATVCAIGRVVRADLQAIVTSGAAMADVICSTSDIQMEQSQKTTRQEALVASREAVRFIKDAGLACMFTPMDASRTDPGFLAEICQAAQEEGADIIGFTDTVGICTPESIAEMIRHTAASVSIPVSVHCHDDFGLATANTVAGLAAGASMFQGCMNGLGERAGNASLEEIVAVLHFLKGIKTHVDPAKLQSTARVVERISKMAIPPNKPVVGANVFTHESGIHAAGIMRNKATFEPGVMTPEAVGHRRRLVVGKHAGRHGIERALNEAGVHPNADELSDIVKRVRAAGARGKQVLSTDLFAIAETVMQKMPQDLRTVQIEQFVVTTGDKIVPTASVQAKVRGEDRIVAHVGVGPVDAAFGAVKQMLEEEAKLEITEYHVDAITGGSDATVRVSVTVGDETGRTASADAANVDMVIASVDALLTATNHLLRLAANGEGAPKEVG